MKGITILIIAFYLFSCNPKKNEAPKEQQPAVAHAFYYYPKPNVYFDTTTKAYFYFDSTKKGWQSGSLPSGLQTDMGKGVFIQHPSQPVWTDNKEHRLEYAAALYADSSDFKNPKVIKKQEVIKPQPTPQQKRSKVKTFFDKIFHKRRNP